MDFIFFLGRFHVLALHLPIGIIFAAVGAEVLVRRRRFQQLKPAVPWLWGGAALTSMVTVVLGLMHFSEGGFEGGSGDAHRFYGISVAVTATLIWLACSTMRRFYERSLWLPGSALVLFLLIMTGHYGGNLTHGPTYLVEYAPGPVRGFAGLAPARPEITELGQADIYLDLIAPMLQTRCVSCHNSEKRRGGLDLSNHGAILAGGESGPAVTPGDAGGSELFHRVTLPGDHDDFMPAEGKTPLRDEQVEILEWWISTGAPAGGNLEGMDIATALVPSLERQVGLAPVPSSESELAQADPALVARLYQAGFVVRQVSINNPLLRVAVYSPGSAVTKESLAELSAAAPHIAELDLQRADLDDADVEALGLDAFENLSWLRLSNNDLSDASVHHLASAGALEYLNLYGNSGITDDSESVLAAMDGLRRLYLWQTGMNVETLQRLQDSASALAVEAGSVAHR